jgi:YjbE family integral membrane protein
MEELMTEAFWAGLLKIIGVNIILSGDNAVVIALAARSLPHNQQMKAVWWCSGAAVVMRVVLTFFAMALLHYPYLKLIGAVLLLYIGLQLLLPEKESHEVKSANNLFAAIKTILIADLVMSLDNVLAVAAAAGDSTLLLILGLAISIPLVVFGSTLLLKVMERFPIIITLGAGLLGFVAGEMAIEDPAIRDWVSATFTRDAGGHAVLFGMQLKYLCGALGAAFVVGLGKWLLWRRAASSEPAKLAGNGEAHK